MFTVPGWSVPATALKMQTSGTSQSETPQAGGSQPTAKVNGKRKRAKGPLETSHINSANLAYLWETVVEKRATEKQSETVIKYDEKRRKTHKCGVVSQTPNAKQSGASSRESLELMQNVEAAVAEQSRKKKVNLPLNIAASTETPDAHNPIPITQLTSLQESMRQKLISARFRYLNQTLYTTPSADSLKLFNENPEMFQEYHEGFRRQVKIWPENPVINYVSQIRQRGKLQTLTSGDGKMANSVSVVPPLPRTEGTCYIADLGCGEAVLAANLSKEKKKLKIKVLSYDLRSTSPLVTKSDIASLPLEDGSIDIAIFCLALMGTNWIDFIEEAFRILRWKGELWITETKSRFSQVSRKERRFDYGICEGKKLEINAYSDDDSDMRPGDGKKSYETDISAFIEVLRRRGFVLPDNMAVDLSNKMFVKMSFIKGQAPVEGKCVAIPKEPSKFGMAKWKKAKAPKGQTWTLKEANILRPCVYKLR
jgi:ribosomal RNA-processing protein 8